MKAFEFGHRLVDSYARFSRSFSTIRSEDLHTEIDRQYEAGRFWPDALLSINPRFLQGPTVDELVASGDLDEATGRIFRFGLAPLRFHRHQAQSIAKARAGQSYVVTTGTGSGKSLCFFVPVVDAIVRARKAGKARRISAIIVYPMNALANSQINEIEKFISQSGLPTEIRPVVRRYTGQESQEERQRIADNPPDILLTNFMMAETGGDIDLRFWHAASGRNLFVRIQAKRLNAESDVAKTKQVKIKNRAYNELLHKPPKALDYQFRTLRDAPDPWIPLYMFYNHHSVTRDPAFAGTTPTVRGINLAFACDIAEELELKLASAPKKRLNHKRLSHLQKHFFGIEAILCPPGSWNDEGVPPPDFVQKSLREFYRQDVASIEGKDDRDAVFRRLMEPSGLVVRSDVARRLPDGPSIRVRQHDVDVPTITFISGRTTDDRTPNITNNPDAAQG